MFGRQIIFTVTYCALTAFNAGSAGSQNSWTLIILRFFAGAFGASPLTNAGGVIADMFHAKQRGIAMSLFAAAPFLGMYFFFPSFCIKRHANASQVLFWVRSSVASSE
jgi:MFS family permease